MLKWHAKFEAIIYIIYYLYDFLILVLLGGSKCRQELESLLPLFDRLWVPVVVEKEEGPSTYVANFPRDRDRY